MKPSKDQRPKVALVDSDILVYRVGFASDDVDEATCLARVTSLLYEIVYDNLKCDDYKAYITGRGNFRNEIAVTEPYKGNRKDAKKPKHYDAIRKHLQRLGAELVEGQEADDAVAIEASTNGGWIVSIDKDLDQVAGWHYNFVKHEEYYVTEEEGLRNFYTQVLTGDRIDSIPGLKGIGPKKAAKILDGCTTEQELYEACVKAYSDAGLTQERMLEAGTLLWLRREPNQTFRFPSTSLGVSGQSST
jgi:5'-3' exonuclease